MPDWKNKHFFLSIAKKSQMAFIEYPLNLDRSKNLNNDILNAFLNQKSISYESIRNINDAKLLRLSWIYDLNYEYSIKYLKESKYLDNILDTMPEFDEIQKIRRTIDDYIIKKENEGLRKVI